MRSWTNNAALVTYPKHSAIISLVIQNKNQQGKKCLPVNFLNYLIATFVFVCSSHFFDSIDAHKLYCDCSCINRRKIELLIIQAILKIETRFVPKFSYICVETVHQMLSLQSNLCHIPQAFVMQIQQSPFLGIIVFRHFPQRTSCSLCTQIPGVMGYFWQSLAPRAPGGLR